MPFTKQLPCYKAGPFVGKMIQGYLFVVVGVTGIGRWKQFFWLKLPNNGAI